MNRMGFSCVGGLYAKKGEVDILCSISYEFRYHSCCEGKAAWPIVLKVEPELICCDLSPTNRRQFVSVDQNPEAAELWSLERNTWALVQALYA